MKKQLLTFSLVTKCICTVSLLLSTTYTIYAQPIGRLWGMADGIFNYDALLRREGVFTSLTGYPYGSLIQAKDGCFYGMTSNGTSKYGGIFKTNGSGTAYTYLFNFNKTDGYFPYGNLVQAADSNLYGMTWVGGTGGYGVIFKCTTSGTETVLHNFDSVHGSNPRGSLIQVRGGNLYGMTEFGDKYQFGNIFKCSTSGVFTVLATFNDTNGAQPFGDLLYANDGNLYGMTNTGGKYGYGVLFKCDTLGNLKTIFNFNDTNGSHPYGSLIQATDGNLYGMTEAGTLFAGGGTLFKCTTTGKLTTLVEFYGGDFNNGLNPYGNIIQASDGNFYGETEIGGDPGYGTVFEYTASGSFNVLINFGTGNGANPYYEGLIEGMSVDIVVTDSSCTNEVLTALVRGAIPPYKITWWNGDTTNNIPDITAAGTYSVTVTDSRGVTVSNSLTLAAYKQVSAHDSLITEPCYGGNTGEIEVIASGGVAPYTYNGNPYFNDFSNLGAGTYYDTVHDASGCSDTTSYTLTAPTTIPVALNQSVSFCAGNSITVNTHTYDSTGAYVDTIKNSQGCYELDSTEVTVYPLPVITITGLDSITSGTADTLIVHGVQNSTYWSTSGTLDTIIVYPHSDSTYYVRGGDSNNCYNRDSIKVYVNIITSINNLANNNGASLYPNPVQQTLHLALAQNMQNATLEISDILGNKLETENITIHDGVTIPVNVSSLAPGVYFAKIISGNQCQTLRFVKQ